MRSQAIQNPDIIYSDETTNFRDTTTRKNRWWRPDAWPSERWAQGVRLGRAT